MPEKTRNNFSIAFIFAAVITVATGIFLLLYGKNETFFLINGNHNNYLDFFFKYITYTGDGWMWVAVLLFCIFFRRKYLVAVLAGVVISTLLSQFLKRVIFIEDLRPITFLSENFPVHLVEGVKMNSLHSFPSGHSAAAFTMALILAHMINKKSWSVILPALALLAGYSRVYLAQHFLTDVLAGMCIGMVSALLSLMLYRSFISSINKRASSVSKTTS